MKIPYETHLEIINAGRRYIHFLPDILANALADPRSKNLAMRVRWDFAYYILPSEFYIDNFYAKGANDDHLDFALRKALSHLRKSAFLTLEQDACLTLAASKQVLTKDYEPWTP